MRPPVTDPDNEHIFHQYTIRAPRRDDLQAHLKAQGIGCAVYYPMALHLQPCFADLGYRRGSLPATEQAMAEVLSLPIYPELTMAQQGRSSRRCRSSTHEPAPNGARNVRCSSPSRW